MNEKPSASALSEIQPETLANYSYQIREKDLDSFGHVNNAVYMVLFEEARWEVITERGYGLQKVHALKIGPVILEVTMKFKREVANRERITIKTGILKHQGKISVLRQVMLNERGEEACVADFVIGLFDLKARKLIEYTPEWLQALGLK